MTENPVKALDISRKISKKEKLMSLILLIIVGTFTNYIYVLTVNICVQAPVTAGEAHYVHGEIPGRNPDRYILITGHYNAYWDGFQDNATSLGSMMVIAKAMLDTGYQPESTFIFEINGAEEYGLTDKYFDFACGADAIVRQHPEWIEGGIAFNNFELSGHCETDGYVVACAHGYSGMIEEFLEGLDFVSDTMAVPNPSVQADDVVMSKAGLPSYINVYLIEAEDPDSFELYDHTSWDNVDRFQPEVFERNNRVFGLLNLLVDRQPAIPLDLTELTAWCRDDKSFQYLPQVYSEWDSWSRTLDTFEAVASRMTGAARKLNQEYGHRKDKASEEELRELYARGWDYTRAIKSVYMLIERELVKYDAFMSLIPGHSQPCLFAAAIEELVEALKAASPGSALGRLLPKGCDGDDSGSSQEAVPAAGKNYSISTKVRDLIADPEAVKVLEEIAPGITSHPDLEWVLGMKLKSVAPISGGLLTRELLADMDEALKKL